MYGWIAAGISTAVLAGLLWISDKRLDNARESLAQTKVIAQIAHDANGKLVEGIELCHSINTLNQEAQANAEARANEAVARAKRTENALNDLLEEPFEVDNTECRTLTEPLPTDFVERVCIASAGNC